MTDRIEDYALIGDCRTAALVSRSGSIDWLCLPRFDGPACFAALLGSPEHGRWQIAPVAPVREVRRRYRPETLVLETDFITEAGTCRLVDCMSIHADAPTIVRTVTSLDRPVAMRMELRIRFDYGRLVPWVTRDKGHLIAIAGPDQLVLRTTAFPHGEDLATMADFTASPGEMTPFVLSHGPSHLDPPAPVDAGDAVQRTEQFWREWSARCTFQGRWREPVVRSLITLKALTYAPTGGIVAAPTTSLPEQIGGTRNWDYRFCWLRDATFTLMALMRAGYRAEAQAWRAWLVRAAAGLPAQLQPIYSVTGERRLEEWEIDWLPGFGGSRPVRIGNGAYGQLQLDTYGEITDALHFARRAGLAANEASWALQTAMLEHLENLKGTCDRGIWETRGPEQHFTHSKVMCWVAFDRAIAAIEDHGLAGPLERWKKVAADLHAEICERAYDPQIGAFTQAYESKLIDAATLLMPIVGFLPADDPRIIGTVEAVKRTLLVDGFVLRYDSGATDDGLPEGEGVFLACSFWLADNLALQGRREEAEAMFERLLAIRNDVGLLAEEYDPRARTQLGNFPQALSHLALIDTAYNLIAGAQHSTARAPHDGEGKGAAA